MRNLTFSELNLWHVTRGGGWAFSQNVSFLALMVWELQVTYDTWHVTPDTWNATRDTLHVSRDTQGVVSIVSKFQVPSYDGFGVIIFWRLGGKGSVTEWINDKCVCRTAPATPGLLKFSGFSLKLFPEDSPALQHNRKNNYKISQKCFNM